jgi:thermitase
MTKASWRTVLSACLFGLVCSGIAAIFLMEHRSDGVRGQREATTHDVEHGQRQDPARNSVAGMVLRAPQADGRPVHVQDGEIAGSVGASSNGVTGEALEKLHRDRNAIPGEYIIKLRDGNAFSAFLATELPEGATVVDSIAGQNVVRLRVSSPDQMDKIAAKWGTSIDISANYRVVLPSPPPDEPTQPETGYVSFGNKALPWLGVKGENAEWGAGVTVAVLDTGVTSHSGLEGVDIRRIDLVNEAPAAQSDGNSHATDVALIVVGQTDDAPGLAPSADILSVKVADSNGAGDSFTLAKGIIEAVDNGAQIVIVCLGSGSPSAILEDAVGYALQRGVAVVAAAGNDGKEGLVYPARYEGAIAVAAVDATRRKLYFSNTGPEVDIAAPGYGVVTEVTEEGAATFSGTSAAVPFVAAAVAALLSEESGLSPADAAKAAVNYTDDVGMPGDDEDFGAGVLNVDRVMNRDVPGICDMAISDHYLPRETIDEQTYPLVVSVQNRGTVPVASAVLKVWIDQRTNVLSITDIGVGETVGWRLSLTADEVRSPDGVIVMSRITVLSATDANAVNNMKRTRIKVPQELQTVPE